MSIEVKCSVCNRKIHNLATSHKCSDGTYVGPTCHSKLSKYEDLPQIESLLLSKEESKNKWRELVIHKRRHLSGKEFLAVCEDDYMEAGGMPWDSLRKNIFERPAHPHAIDSIDPSKLIVFNQLLANREEGPAGGFKKVDQEDISRSVHCFLKLFKDPGISKEDYELIKSLGLKLIGVSPVWKNKEGAELGYCKFIVTSSNSPFAERAISIEIGHSGDVNFRCINMTEDGYECSLRSTLMIQVPSAKRKSGECQTYNAIKAFVLGVFATSHPEHTPGFKYFFPDWHKWKSVISGWFEFKDPGPEPQD